MDPMADLSEGHILFNSARALLNWFGVTLNKDVKAMTQKWQKMKNGIQAARLLGGLQWTAGNEEKPLRLFVGNSCVRNVVDGEEVCGHFVQHVHFEQTKWDTSNNTMCTTPTLQTSRVGHFVNSDDLTSVFRISWVWKGSYGGSSISPHGRRVCAKLGELKISLPTITICGDSICAAIRYIINEHLLPS